MSHESQFVPKFTDEDIKKLRRLNELVAAGDEPGLDDVRPSSCYTNGMDTAIAEGHDPASPDFEEWVEYWTLVTAKLAELV
jgi:hypothetical protein